MRAAGYWPYDALEIENPGLTFIARAQLGAAIAGLVEQVEVATGWYPFVADTTDAGAVNETRYFDSVELNGMLDLGAGLLQLTGVTVRGNSLILNQNVWPQPANALNRKQAYTMLRIGASASAARNDSFGWSGSNMLSWNVPNQIAVTGLWGRSLVWPADMWDSVRKLACVAPLSQLNTDQQLQSWSEDGLSESYDVASTIRPVLLWSNWQKEFDALVRRYMRIVC